ncbi:MAG TPA: hypothetical protein DC047_02580 [Blastocatellia bacterium]|nr:hypothetical protein [Blastocatellia bacterium]
MVLFQSDELVKVEAHRLVDFFGISSAATSRFSRGLTRKNANLKGTKQATKPNSENAWAVEDLTSSSFSDPRSSALIRGQIPKLTYCAGAKLNFCELRSMRIAPNRF